MLFLNSRFDVTLAPLSKQRVEQTLQSSQMSSVDSCIQNNRIMKGHGQPCWNVMCQCMSNGSGYLGCPQLSGSDYDKISNFCGMPQEGGFFMNGAYWDVQRQDYTQSTLPQSLQQGMAAYQTSQGANCK